MLDLHSILRSPLPHLDDSIVTRALLRLVLLGFGRRIVRADGLARLDIQHDPFILALNHSERAEAVLLPAFLAWCRHGRHIHFLADWNFLLIPGIGSLMRRAETIPVCRKPARPRVLTYLRPFVMRGRPHGLEGARHHLVRGESIGVFPEGTVNPEGTTLLAGCHGAARLALETGASVIPAGVRYMPSATRSPSWLRPMSITVGEPLAWHGVQPTRTAVRDAHVSIMQALEALSGRSWKAHQRRRNPCPSAFRSRSVA